jgi:hypothetical protein
MSDALTNEWQRYIEERIECRATITREGLGEALNEICTGLRKEIAVLRDSPPLFSAPDKALAKVMTRLGAELHGQREAIDTLRRRRRQVRSAQGYYGLALPNLCGNSTPSIKVGCCGDRMTQSHIPVEGGPHG